MLVLWIFVLSPLREMRELGGAPANVDDFLLRVNCFSFATPISLGYGDITPIHPFARSLVTMEALAGQRERHESHPPGGT